MWKRRNWASQSFLIVTHNRKGRQVNKGAQCLWLIPHTWKAKERQTPHLGRWSVLWEHLGACTCSWERKVPKWGKLAFPEQVFRGAYFPILVVQEFRYLSETVGTTSLRQEETTVWWDSTYVRNYIPSMINIIQNQIIKLI